MKALLIKAYNKIFPILRRLKFIAKYRFKVMPFEATIAYIKAHDCSIARYGDGEFGLITKSNNPDFQQPNTMIAKRLSLICTSNDPRLLVCIPHNFRTTRDCNEFAKKFWEWWLWENNNL